LPELVGLVAKAIAPVMLGAAYDRATASPSSAGAFSEHWCPPGARAAMDELCPLSGKHRAVDDAHASLSGEWGGIAQQCLCFPFKIWVITHALQEIGHSL
jgi:hypothetical protein